MPKIKCALISVYDKTGIVDFARQLVEWGVTIISTGGTAVLLKNSNVPHRLVEDVTQFPELLDGRVKTLHPHIFMGILSLREKENHRNILAKYGLTGIDMVVVNLYPFVEASSNPQSTIDTVLENIDIGGVALLRAAAKNFKNVVSVSSPTSYDRLITTLSEKECSISEEESLQFALEAFSLTSAYDWYISNYLCHQISEDFGFSKTIHMILERVEGLRYGENPHQKAALYSRPLEHLPYCQLSGKELSYNNLADIDSALALSYEYEKPAAVIIKHTNPCGVAYDAELVKAFEKALATDSVSAFGGIIGLNRPLDVLTAQKISQMFVEAVVAPDYVQQALEILSAKKNLRILKVDGTFHLNRQFFEFKTIYGGVLLQDRDISPENPASFRVVTKRKPTEAEWEAMLFGWKMIKYVKSNAVVYCAPDRTLGIGMGQPSRIDSSEIAVMKAQKANINLKGSVVISDAFFPFRDGIDAAYEAGATAIIQPGGSIRDDEVIAAAEESSMAMVFTGYRHFRH
jgi:phosphoribosylaminoimidazolecarboxamide formyltransferase/IMP cyclohydrolase